MKRLLLVCLMIPGHTASATIINVPADYPTIQQGIDASIDGDTVLVQPGTYIENISIANKGIVLASNYIFSMDTLDIANTILDGDSTGGFALDMRYCNDLSKIIGLKFTDGDQWDRRAIDAGYCDSVIIEHNFFESYDSICVIHANHNSNLGILSNVFRYNNSDHIIMADGSVIIKDNAFNNNIVMIMLWCDFVSLIVENNIIHDNEGMVSWWYHMDGIIRGNLIYNNHCNYGYDVGGIFMSDDSEYSITNNTIYNNTGVNGSYLGYFMCGHYAGPVDLINNIIWDNNYDNPESTLFGGCYSPTIIYSDIQGGWPGEGNIECDPQFCDPDSGNFYLDGNSCCIGAGQNGENMGVYGVGCWSACSTYVVGDVNGSGAFDGLDITYGVSYLKGGPAPKYVCECTPGNILYAAGDVNGSCSYNGLDITYGVSYLKGGFYLIPCPDCRPVPDRTRR